MHCKLNSIGYGIGSGVLGASFFPTAPLFDFPPIFCLSYVYI